VNRFLLLLTYFSLIFIIRNKSYEIRLLLNIFFVFEGAPSVQRASRASLKPAKEIARSNENTRVSTKCSCHGKLYFEYILCYDVNF
jgi:hypothetical protein